MSKIPKDELELDVKAIAKDVKDSTKSEDVYSIRDKLREWADRIDSFWVEYPGPGQP